MSGVSTRGYHHAHIPYHFYVYVKKIISLFQSLLLFTNVIMDSAGIDYHVILAGNLFQQCLDNPGLQQELLCALCKQTSRILTHSSKHGVQVKKQHSIKHTRVSHYFYLVCSFLPPLCPFLSLSLTCD